MPEPTGLTLEQHLRLPTLDAETVYRWQERAAILEYDAGLPRADAEAQAWAQEVGLQPGEYERTLDD